MRADDTLRTLCRRHGVDEGFGRRLLPLLERAQAAPPEVRDRLLGLVEQSLARESERRRELQEAQTERAERALLNVARALHAWNPPEDFDPEHHAPEGFDPGRVEPDDEGPDEGESSDEGPESGL